MSDQHQKIYHNGYSFPWHRWFVHSFESALKTMCGFQGATPYWDWRKGKSHRFITFLEDNKYRADASNVYGSSFFDSDPESGLGGFGAQDNDFEVQDGGFGVNSTFRLSYPSPHALRRNFTLQPFLLANAQTEQFILEPAQYANVSLTYSAIDDIVNGFVGDFKGLQATIDGFEGAVYSAHGIIG